MAAAAPRPSPPRKGEGTARGRVIDVTDTGRAPAGADLIEIAEKRPLRLPRATAVMSFGFRVADPADAGRMRQVFLVFVEAAVSRSVPRR
jgi:hypothetical protein